MNYCIREMKVDEIEKYNNIWDISEQPKRTEFWKNQIQNGNRVTLVYVEENNFIGEGSLMKNVNDNDYTVDGKRLCLAHMRVKEECRNCGIGSKILDALFDYSLQHGYCEISVGVDLENVGARRLYERKGFTTIICECEDDEGKFVKLLKKL